MKDPYQKHDLHNDSSMLLDINDSFIFKETPNKADLMDHDDSNNRQKSSALTEAEHQLREKDILLESLKEQLDSA